MIESSLTGQCLVNKLTIRGASLPGNGTGEAKRARLLGPKRLGVAQGRTANFLPPLLLAEGTEPIVYVCDSDSASKMGEMTVGEAGTESTGRVPEPGTHEVLLVRHGLPPDPKSRNLTDSNPRRLVEKHPIRGER